MPSKKTMIYTIGHSTHTLEEFIKLLQHYKITRVIDIRTIPRSRHNPQFNSPELSHALKHVNIAYTHLKELGGLRHPKTNSINTAWRNASFRGFADYMQTDEFKKGLATLIEYAQHETIVIMCAEAVPWRCHRSLIGDALLIRGIDVMNIFSEKSVKPHTLTPWAHIKGTEIIYQENSLATHERKGKAS